jgi:hypothetical protein
MINKVTYWAIISGATLALFSLQGCMASTNSLPANKALALSASALSGSESYGFSGEVSVINPGGFVGSKAAYEGEVTSHGNMKMKWTNSMALTTTTKPHNTTSYQPLQLLESINSQSAVISYVQAPSPNRPVHLQIKLDDDVARKRVVAGLRADLALLRSDNNLLKGNRKEADKILSNAGKRLDTAISTLKVTTVCDWTTDPKDWFPNQLKEETVLTYMWDNKPCREKRVSKTNFLHNAQNGTMKKVNK